MTTIDKVVVRVDSTYDYTEDQRQKYKLQLELPLPGGKAVYELPITKEFHDNITAAAKLTL
jgi:hypothetical protein